MTAPTAGARATAADVLSVVGVALGVRLLVLWTLHDAVFFRVLQTEPLRYHKWALAWLNGQHLRPPYEEAPGFVAMVAAIYAVVGPWPLAVAWVNAGLDALSAGAVAAVAARLGGRSAGWVAGGAYALYAPCVYFTAQLEPASLACLAVAAATWCTPTGGDRGWTRAGAAWAAAALVRTELLLAVPVILVHAGTRGGLRAVLRAGAVPAALIALSLTANLVASGRPVLTTTGAGANLWIGNGPLADGVNPFVAGPRAIAAARIVGDARDASTADRRLLAATADHARAHPGLVARLALRKLAWTFTARELPNAADIEWQRSQSWALSGPVPIGFGVLLPAAAVGLVLLGPRRSAAVPLAAPVFAAVVVSVVFFTNARFRLGMAPSLAVLAGIAWVGLLEIRGPPVDRRGVLRAAAACALALGVVWADFDGVSEYRVPQIDMNTAALEGHAGQTAAGLARLQHAVAAAPFDPAGWIQLATALEAAGEPTGAARAWHDAERHLPDDAGIARGAAAFRSRRQRRVAPTRRTPTGRDPRQNGGRRHDRHGQVPSDRPHAVCTHRTSEVRRCG